MTSYSSPDLLYQIALTMIPGIGAVQIRKLTEHFGTAKAIFQAPVSQLMKIEGIGEGRSRMVRSFNSFRDAENEIRFIEKFQIHPLFIAEPVYPQRLLRNYDSPPLLYSKGNADLNASRIIAIVGTRHHTDYGRQLTEQFIADLASRQVTVASGLAYGIDAIAHRSALRHHLPTVAVLGHGLDQIYPAHHKELAREMILHGGLLTEFRSATKPDKHNFPIRNRIVAGISDATIVVETGVRGGSMITAEFANDYNRDVFAFPGRVTDSRSAGCHDLIRNNKAMILTDAAQLVDCMNWAERQVRGRHPQKALFIELSQEEKILLQLLSEKEAMHIDEINIRSGLSSSMVASVVLNLELQNIVLSRPGNMYSLC